MKSLSIAVLAFVFASGALAQTKPAPAKATAAKKQNLSADFAKAAYLFVEAVANESPKRDDLMAEMKFAASEDAVKLKDYEVASYLESLYTLYMDLYNQGEHAGMPGMHKKKYSCVLDLESQLKARTWTVDPESCEPGDKK
jgi:hypothetical protein